METKVSATAEDYLEAVYAIGQQRPPRVTEIAARMGVTKPSVSAAMKALAQKGLVRHERYGFVELTAEGERIGEQTWQRHRALVSLLHDVLDLDSERAEAEACQLEHALSPATLGRLEALIGFVRECPRAGDDWLARLRQRWSGEATPGACAVECGTCVSTIAAPGREEPARAPAAGPCPVTLDMFGPGFVGTVHRVGGPGPIRKRMMEMGVTAGSELELRRVAPLGDPIEIIIRGYHLSLRKSEAAHVEVVPKCRRRHRWRQGAVQDMPILSDAARPEDSSE